MYRLLRFYVEPDLQRRRPRPNHRVRHGVHTSTNVHLPSCTLSLPATNHHRLWHAWHASCLQYFNAMIPPHNHSAPNRQAPPDKAAIERNSELYAWGARPIGNAATGTPTAVKSGQPRPAPQVAVGTSHAWHQGATQITWTQSTNMSAESPGHAAADALTYVQLQQPPTLQFPQAAQHQWSGQPHVYQGGLFQSGAAPAAIHHRQAMFAPRLHHNYYTTHSRHSTGKTFRL